jgi:hypothetical protein
MGIVEFDRRPSRKQLLWFGALTAPFFGVVGLLLQAKAGLPGVARVIWGTTALVTLVFFLLPPVRRPLYLFWMSAIAPIGWLWSHVILGVVYYLIVTPIGLGLRLFGRDPLARRLDRGASSYWIERRPVSDASRSFRQF